MAWKKANENEYAGTAFDRDATVCAYNFSPNGVAISDDGEVSFTCNNIAVSKGMLDALSGTSKGFTMATNVVDALPASIEELKKSIEKLQEAVFGDKKSRYEAVQSATERRSKYKTLNVQYEVLK